MISVTYTIECDRCGNVEIEKHEAAIYPHCPMPPPTVRQLSGADVCAKCMKELRSDFAKQMGWERPKEATTGSKH